MKVEMHVVIVIFVIMYICFLIVQYSFIIVITGVTVCKYVCMYVCMYVCIYVFCLQVMCC